MYLKLLTELLHSLSQIPQSARWLRCRRPVLRRSSCQQRPCMPHALVLLVECVVVQGSVLSHVHACVSLSSTFRWNYYHGEISAQLIMDSATQVKKLGLDRLGYNRVNIDGGWESFAPPPPPKGKSCPARPCPSHPNRTFCPSSTAPGQCGQPMPHPPCPPGPCLPPANAPPGCASRGPDGMLSTNPARFPHGLEPVAQHVNKLGLQWGMCVTDHHRCSPPVHLIVHWSWWFGLTRCRQMSYALW